ncbi:hypothetical protein SH661x_004665 [Planctomicrobium sp. SH661]|uniref:hypothetical protein n=1 Tax=Planctomicrobium sp. SH661 TaxID=3448124 RepID=UPI003F5BA227
MNSPLASTASAAIQQRAPSLNWEQVPLPWMPGAYLWVWFKPAQAPGDIVVRVPDELWPALGASLTMRHLLAAFGLNAAEIQFWATQGVTLDSQGGMNPILDQLLPAPVPWADSSITIRLAGFEAGIPQPAPFASSGTAFSTAATAMTPEAEIALAAMDADWQAILQLETQLGQLRKQLNVIQGRLQSMNRDFTPDERQAADSNDVKAWQDARRFLRDASGHVSRYIREHDVGVTSAAGQRNRFEEIYKSNVAPKKAFEGITVAQHELEVYRKQVQSLLAKMQTALSNAGSNGEQRAQQVLNRINAKMRKSRNKD